MDIGDYIRKLRKERNMSIRELAKKSGVSNSYLSQLETGKNTKPTVDFVQKIARGLNVNHVDLFLDYLEDRTPDFEAKKEKARQETPDIIDIDEFIKNLGRAFPFNREIIQGGKSLNREEAQFIAGLFHLIHDVNPSALTQDQRHHITVQIKRLLDGD